MVIDGKGESAMQQHKRWGSIVAALVVGVAVGLTWSVVGGQSRGGAGRGGDGGYAEHRAPGDTWSFEAWPSHMQREYLRQLANYDPPLYAAWSKRLDQAIKGKKLDKRTEMVLVSYMDSIVHWALPVIEQHIEQAF